jgi:hypothetical protein
MSDERKGPRPVEPVVVGLDDDEVSDQMITLIPTKIAGCKHLEGYERFQVSRKNAKHSTLLSAMMEDTTATEMKLEVPPHHLKYLVMYLDGIGASGARKIEMPLSNKTLALSGVSEFECNFVETLMENLYKDYNTVYDGQEKTGHYQYYDFLSMSAPYMGMTLLTEPTIETKEEEETDSKDSENPEVYDSLVCLLSAEIASWIRGVALENLQAKLDPATRHEGGKLAVPTYERTDAPNSAAAAAT